MTTAISTTNQPGLDRIADLVLASVTAANTRRAYKRALDHFLEWVTVTRPQGFSKATVQAYRNQMIDEGIGQHSVNQRLSVVKKLALELADNQIIDEATAQAIKRIKGIKVLGQKTGNWMTRDQAQAFLRKPDLATTKGIRDRAILAVMIGCGLRRTEVTTLTVEHIQQRDGRWAIIDLTGKHNRTRTIPMPSWAKVAIDAWMKESKTRTGVIFRPVRKGGNVAAGPMTSQAVRNLVHDYAAGEYAAHDLRRTYAKLAREGGSEIDQIQLSLGHASVATTQKYIGDNQDFHDAPCDRLGLSI